MSAPTMTIGQLARRTGLTPRAIRYYERLGLIERPRRTESNYRLFDFDSLERLHFIGKCRALGSSIAEIAELIQVAGGPDYTCAEVAAVIRHHLDVVDDKIASVMKMREVLAKNLSRCTGKDVPDCPALDFLTTCRSSRVSMFSEPIRGARGIA